MTTLLSPTEIGKYSLISTAIAFFAMLFVNPIGMLINRKTHAWFDNEQLAARLVLYIPFLFLVATLTLPVLLFAINFFEIGSTRENLHFAAIYFCSILFGTLVQTFILTFNLLGENKIFIFLSISFSILSLICAYSMVNFLEYSAKSWMMGLAISQLIFCLFSGYIFIKSFSIRISFQQIRKVIPNTIQINQTLLFSIPIAITATIGWMNFQGYRFLISESDGLQEFGLFAAGYGLAASLLAAVEQILSAWFQPLFYSNSNSSNKEQREGAWMTYLNSMLPVTTLAVCAIAVASSNLVPIFLGPAFSQSVPYVAAGAFAELGRVYLGAFMMRGHQVMNTSILIRPAIFSVTISVALILSIQAIGELTLVPFGIFVGAIVGCFIIYRRRLNNSIANLEHSRFLASAVYFVPMLIMNHFFNTTAITMNLATNIAWLFIKLIATLPVLIWLMKDFLPSHMRNKL